jgi:DNA polymerase I-like protein with 3'-5' exonuclease and polymerase domains
MKIVFDIETDGLLDKLTKIHVMSWSVVGSDTIRSTSDHSVMQEVMHRATTIVGHNVVAFDLAALKMFGITTKANIIDTLPLSWYLEPTRIKHGLADWGVTVGVPKPVVDDWDNLTYDEYKHRCEEDVKINLEVLSILDRKLQRLYRDEGEAQRLTDYLTFKMQCARDQEVHGWRLDLPKAQALQETLQQLKDKTQEELSAAMPTVPVTKVVNPPSEERMFNKDGRMSKWGLDWQQTLRDNYMPDSTNQPITVLVKHEAGKPSSHIQVKDWLYDLGWKPQTFKYVRGDSYGEERKIPQIRDGSDLCPSVIALAEQEPSIKLLENLTVTSHRLGVVNAFISCEVDGWLTAGISGLTNTFRFKHRKPLVNLPAVDKPWGKEIRGCLIAPEGEVLVGCDMVSLEDTTKRHYMQPIDPDYVAEMQLGGFDPHLDLAKHAGAVTQEQIDQHNAGEISLGSIRKGYKAANYACVYGVGAATLSRTTGLKQQESKKLIEAYWKRNWAVEKIAETRKTRDIKGEKWILNEVSGFWHSLRSEKDRWSTTNQSTGVYCFDQFVKLVTAAGERVIGQFHDEVIVATDDPKRTEKVLLECKDELNNNMKLNVPLGIDYAVGNNYSEIH